MYPYPSALFCGSIYAYDKILFVSVTGLLNETVYLQSYPRIPLNVHDNSQSGDLLYHIVWKASFTVDLVRHVDVDATVTADKPGDRIDQIDIEEILEFAKVDAGSTR